MQRKPQAVPSDTRVCFELWREDHVLRLIIACDAVIDTRQLKEILRLLDAVDPTSSAPVLLELEERTHFDAEARALLHRACTGRGRPVAFMAHDVSDRLQGEFFVRSYAEKFPCRAFTWREEAARWVTAWSRSPELRVVR